MTTPAPRFFHGTFAALTVGDVLRPGNEIGLTHHGRSAHVYGTSTEFDVEALEWLDEWDTPQNRLGHAIDEAIEWAAHAADGLCTDRRHENPDGSYGFHYECVVEGEVPGCLRVYEIEPVGPVEQDSSSDPGPSAVMMSSARVIALVDLPSRPVAFLPFSA
jgi:hypothetical protein